MSPLVLCNALMAALTHQHECSQMVLVDEERLRLSRERLTAAGNRVNEAERAIRQACEPERVSQTLGELFKKHGLR